MKRILIVLAGFGLLVGIGVIWFAVFLQFNQRTSAFEGEPALVSAAGETSAISAVVSDPIAENAPAPLENSDVSDIELEDSATAADDIAAPNAVAEGAAQAANGSAMRIMLGRTSVPIVPYQDVTLRIPVGSAIGLQAIAADGSTIPFKVDTSSNEILLTTDSSWIDLVFDTSTGANTVGDVTVTPLKNDKKWIWSHGFDDNVYIDAAVEEFRQRGLQASIFLITNMVDDTRDEGWIMDAVDLFPLIDEGWAIGNHTTEHQCDASLVTSEMVKAADTRLREVVAASNRPDYQPITFAAPCFESSYDPIMRQLRDAGEITALFNESGGYFVQMTDPGITQTFTIDEKSAVPFDFESPLGRDARIEWDTPAVKAQFDWMAAHATPDRHFWYNTLAHGQKETQLADVLTYIVSNYGADGTNEAWIAPSEEVYSYLLVRDRIIIEKFIIDPADVTAAN